MKRAIKLAYIYVLTSVVVGPALVFTASSNDPSGWDCGDSSWGMTPIASREAFYEHAARFMKPIASLMIVLGVGLLAYLLLTAIKNKSLKRIILPTLLILIMFAGYGLLISVVSASWCYSHF